MKKRIACITEYATVFAEASRTSAGTGAAYVSELVSQLAESGWEVDVFTHLTDNAQSRIRLVNSGIRVIYIAAGAVEPNAIDDRIDYLEGLSNGVAAFIAEERTKYDLIHSNSYIGGLVAIELKKRLKIPFTFTFHELGELLAGQDEQEVVSAERVKAERQIAKRADVLIVQCPQAKADLIQYYNVSPKKTFIVPAGFNPAKFFPINKVEAREILNLDAGEKILLQIGSLEGQKGIDNVIKSMALLDAKAQHIRLIILGAGEVNGMTNTPQELERLKFMAESLGLAKQISFAASTEQDKLKYYYAAADLFITTPLVASESIGLLEAMACGTPVIGSELGAIKFAVVEGKTGFLVPPKSPEVLADRIRLVIKNEALLAQMSRNSVRHANSSFTWEKVARQMLDLYEYVLLSKKHKDRILKPFSTKFVNQAIPLRNAYLKRNLQVKYSN
jgi:D-inositol-3-phosphate glycosyltransferase